jgi:hypothetical protein
MSQRPGRKRAWQAMTLRKTCPRCPIAATVNGVEIPESDVTLRIESSRLDDATEQPLDDAAWARKLKDMGHTPKTFREYVIRNNIGAFILILQRAEKLGITPDAALVDQEIADKKEQVEGAKWTWEEFLETTGYSSEAAYRRQVEARSVVYDLVDTEVPANGQDDEEWARAQQEYLDALIASDEIAINPMPKGLSYDVDMSLADAGSE